MDFEAIRKAAEGYKPAMVKFLRDMIAIPSESCEEEGVVKRIAEELKSLGYDKVEFDKLGNVIGWMGEGDKIIAIDSHIDTVGIGNINNWEADPYKGYETEDIIYGRGGSDQEPAAAGLYTGGAGGAGGGGRGGRRRLRREDHEGSGSAAQGLQDDGGRLRAGGGLRRYVLAVHRQRVFQRSRGRP